MAIGGSLFPVAPSAAAASYSALAVGSAAALGAFQVFNLLAALGAQVLPLKKFVAAVGPWNATFIGIAGSEIPGLLLVLHEAAIACSRLVGGDTVAPAVLKTLAALNRLVFLLTFIHGYSARSPAQRALRDFVKKLSPSGKPTTTTATTTNRELRSADLATVAPDGLTASFILEGLLPYFTPWNVTQILDISYATPEEREKAGPRAERFMQIDVIRKSTGYQNRPIMIYIHGGAWAFGDKRAFPFHCLPLCWHFASKENWVVINANYRLADQANLYDMVVDLKRIVRWIHENPSIHGGDPNYIAVSGGSAGGHLAAVLALTQNDPKFQPGFESVPTTIRAILPIYGALRPLTGPSRTSGFAQFFRRKIVKFDDDASRALVGKDVESWADCFGWLNDEERRVRDEKKERRPIPPMFIIQGASDSLVPAAAPRDFLVDLARVAPDAVAGYLELPRAHHGFDSFSSPRTCFTLWAAGGAMEALYSQWKSTRRSTEE